MSGEDPKIIPDATSDAKPDVFETPPAITESSAQAPTPEKTARAGQSVKPVKPVKPIKAARARKAGKVEETVAPAEEEAAKTVTKAVKAAKPAKSVKPEKAVKAAKGAAVTKTSEAAKPAKPAETAKTIKPAKVARSTKKAAKATPAAAPKQPAKIAATGRSNGARYTTNELNSAAKKAGLTVELTPVVTKPAHIGRGPAKEFKVDGVIAHLRGSDGGLIRDRGPGTTFYNDAESLAAVAIFEEFRGRTFHNKLKVEIL